MLERGGSAVDAMIATQLVLGLVEPQSSGLGGGAFLLLLRREGQGACRAIDGARDRARGAPRRRCSRSADGKPMAFLDARVGGRSVGVPGTPRLLEVAHARHGKLPWAALFEPAIALAEKGFPMSPRVSQARRRGQGPRGTSPRRAPISSQPTASPSPSGTMLRNPEFAATLRAIAAQGADAFYTGEIAADIVAAVRAPSRTPAR